MTRPAQRRKTSDAPGIGDLDNGCLLRIFTHLSPLPDLFQIARTCRRFNDLTSDRRLWLTVTASAEAQPVQLALWNLQTRFKTVQEAVDASRPGDTIMLAPGQQHCVANVVVRWPLHVLGGGSRAEDTVIVCPKGADAAFDFRSSGKLANLTVRTIRSPAVQHCRGRLVVERCVLTCSAQGLDHLLAPLLTTAVTCEAEAVVAAPPAARVRALRPPKRLLPGRAPAGRGSLVVVESKLLGGGAAVRCCGTGALRGVRVIVGEGARSATFWFNVDSAVGPRTAAHSGLPLPWVAAGAAGGSSGGGVMPPPPTRAEVQAAWRGDASPLPLALEEEGAEVEGCGVGGVRALDLKAKQWSAHQHALARSQ